MLGNRGSVPTQPIALPWESDGFSSLPLTSPVTEGKFLGSLNLSSPHTPPVKKGRMTGAPPPAAVRMEHCVLCEGTTAEQLSAMSSPSSRALMRVRGECEIGQRSR